MSLPSSRGSCHSPKSRSRSRSKEKGRVTFMDNVKKQLGRFSGTEDDQPDGAEGGLGAIPKLPKVDPITSPTPKPVDPITSPTPKPVVRSMTSGEDFILPPDSEEVFESAGQFFMNSGLERQGQPVLHEVKLAEDGTACLKYLGKKWDRFHNTEPIAQKIKEGIKTIKDQKAQQQKEKQEFPNKALKRIMEGMEVMEQKLSHLQMEIRDTKKHIQNDPSQFQESKVRSI